MEGGPRCRTGGAWAGTQTLGSFGRGRGSRGTSVGYLVVYVTDRGGLTPLLIFIPRLT